MVTNLLLHYGLIALFGLILLESIGLPLPGETALLLAAASAARGLFPIWLVMLVAASAAIIGDSIGYWAGARFGLPLLTRYGQRLGVTPERLAEAQGFMARHGPKAVFFGRFIAVLRVFAAFLSGVSKMHYRRFLLYNALGGITWAALVGTIGYLFGSQLPLIERWARQVGWWGAAGAALIGLAVLVARRRPSWDRVRGWVAAHSRVVGALAVCLLAVALFAQLADSVLERETLVTFDQRLADRLHVGVPAALLAVTLRFTDLGSIGVLVLGVVGGALLAWWRRLWDLGFWVLAFGGGEGLNLLLKQIFQRPRPSYAEAVGATFWSFPSGHAMVSLVAYGALAVLLGRSYPQHRLLIYTLLGILVLLIGASRLVLGVHYFSDVLAGFAAGLAWLALCVGIFGLYAPAKTPLSPATPPDQEPQTAR